MKTLTKARVYLYLFGVLDLLDAFDSGQRGCLIIIAFVGQCQDSILQFLNTSEGMISSIRESR